MPEDFDPTTIEDPMVLRQVVIFLLNIVEKLTLENQALREEVQQLRDENNQLKGEQGKPKILPNKKPGDISSVAERRVPRPPKKKSGHRQHLVITETQVLK